MGSPCALVAILHVEQEGKEQERGRRRGREKRRRRKKNAAEGRISKANGCGQGVWPTAQLWEKRGEGNKEGKRRKRGQWKRGPREFSLAQVTVELHRAACGEACHSDPNRFQACSWSVGSDPEPARHVLTTLRFEARTLYTASACHAFNAGK